MKKTVYLQLLMLFAAMPLMAQHVVSGVVTDKNGVPIKGAVVSGMEVYNAETNLDGSFSIESLVPVKKIKVTAPGMNFRVVKAKKDVVVKMKPQTFWNKQPEKWSPFVSLQFGIPAYNEFSIGVMAGIVKKYGFYIKGLYGKPQETTGEFSSFNSGYSVYSGSNTGNFTGNYKYSRSSLTGGFMFRLGSPLYIYTGFGYSFEKMAYETATTPRQWYKLVYTGYDEDHEFGGMDFEVGLMLRYKWVVLNGGFNLCTLDEGAFRPCGHIGLGVCF